VKKLKRLKDNVSQKPKRKPNAEHEKNKLKQKQKKPNVERKKEDAFSKKHRNLNAVPKKKRDAERKKKRNKEAGITIQETQVEMIQALLQVMTQEIPAEVFPQLLNQLLLLLLLLLQLQLQNLLLLQHLNPLQIRVRHLRSSWVLNVGMPTQLFYMGKEKLLSQLKQTSELISKTPSKQTDCQKYLGRLITI
jgi:hypothetical protein